MGQIANQMALEFLLKMKEKIKTKREKGKKQRKGSCNYPNCVIDVEKLKLRRY